MKTKHAIVLFFVGLVVFIIGSTFKILHWPFASYLLVISNLLQIIGAIVFVVKFMKYPGNKDFLNY